MEWAAAEHGAKVVNISLGGFDTPELDPVEQAVNTLTEQTGALFVVAAGNDGPLPGTVSSPGSADAALTVGAVDDNDELAFFSSRGPRVGDGAIKPDITAPGVEIVAARATGTKLGEPVGDSYVRLSGTSMATPHVVGAAAILAQQHPDWTAPRLKAALMGSATPTAGATVYEQGAGRVDLARAITQTVVSEPPSLSFGLQLWPHHDDAPVTRTLTYHNLGTTPVTLALAASFTGPDGAPAPAGSLTLSRASLTVPGNGTADASVTISTRHDGPDGAYTGRITATAGTTVVTTPVAVEKEVESYTLTLRHLDRDGAATPLYSALLFGLDSEYFNFPY